MPPFFPAQHCLRDLRAPIVLCCISIILRPAVDECETTCNYDAIINRFLLGNWIICNDFGFGDRWFGLCDRRLVLGRNGRRRSHFLSRLFLSDDLRRYFRLGLLFGWSLFDRWGGSTTKPKLFTRRLCTALFRFYSPDERHNLTIPLGSLLFGLWLNLLVRMMRLTGRIQISLWFDYCSFALDDILLAYYDWMQLQPDWCKP